MLTLSEINAYLTKLKDWDLDGNSLTKTFQFDNYEKAIIFIDKIMEISSELNHFPEIILNKNIVKVNLMTLSENNLTNKDFELAEAIERNPV